ncbi:MAG: hypothetical protein A2X55_12110 [Nitrospirae bacterium GWB2_47_37]|nr:MAG: hypothetical protein A2X55_12110 [Nitrospirae bacterium GWB2_47_37]HAK89066.1 hypothetical protein [Nitrospiraceae bacterium]
MDEWREDMTIKNYLSIKAYKTIKTPVLIGILGMLLFAVFIFGIFLYYRDSKAAIDEYGRLSDVALQPVADLAARGVDGGDVIMLRSENAKSLYNVSGVKYLKISGRSKGMEKTEFSDAIPPQHIEHEFVKSDSEVEMLRGIASGRKSTHLDRKNWLYIVNVNLKDVKNGGEITAVFPAERLKGYVWKVAKDIGKIAGIVIVLSLLPIYSLLRKMNEPSDIIRRELSQIGNDLTRRLPYLGQNEIGDVCTAFNRFMEDLQKVVSNVADTSTAFASASNELSASAVRIASGTETQNARASQVATASEEMSATITDVAKNTSNASDGAKEANRVASKGSEVMEKTIDSMNAIASTTRQTSMTVSTLGDRSRDIGEIIKVIEDIADQTNLLALNAAIEAARAGEQGRGFAVVADEVRKLAERTTKATKEIGEMIEGIQDDTATALKAMGDEVKAVEEGAGLATEASSALKEIVKRVSEVSSMIQQIATATEQQSTAAGQITKDIETVAGITKETSSGARQIGNTSAEIASLASQLQELVRQFKVA